MKNVFRPVLAFSFLVMTISACTFGDKGEENTSDSVKIDTSQAPAMSSSSGPGSSGSDSGAGDSANMDNSNINTIVKDSVSKNRSANGGADGIKQ
jgi:hypothetical protein